MADPAVARTFPGRADRGAWADDVLGRMESLPAGLAFGARIWLAMALALGTCFWLQLEGASSAAVCVGILAVPTRGQALSKALYRLAATLLGFAVSIAFAANFGQDRAIMLVATGFWLSACVFAANYLEGMRAYGAALSGYTVAIIAIANIDAPQNVFEVGIDRVASNAVGILAASLVNDALSSPTSLARVQTIMREARDATHAMVHRALGGEPASPGALTGIAGRIDAVRPYIQGVGPELADGGDRAAGARLAATAVLGQAVAAADLAAAMSRAGPDGRGAIRQDVDGAMSGDASALRRLEGRAEAALTAQGATPGCVRLHRRAIDVVVQGRLAEAGLAALAGERTQPIHVPLPTVRDVPDALRNAARVGIAFAVTAWLLILAGWPAASAGLVQVGATAALSTINPNPRAFARGVVVGMPIAVASAGLVKFALLDGAQGFPLLALAMAPAILLGGVLLSDSRTMPAGFIVVVFFPAVLAPSNPQSYDPAGYIDTSVSFLGAAAILALVVGLLLPTSDGMRRRWLLLAMRADLIGSLRGRPGDPVRVVARNAGRLAAFAALRRPGRNGEDLVRGEALARLDVAVAGAHRALKELGAVPSLAPAAAEAAAALGQADGAAVAAASERLLAGVAQADGAEDALQRAVADLSSVADAMRDNPRFLRRLRLHPGA